MRTANQDAIITLDEKNIAPVIQMGASSVIGTREVQEDSVLVSDCGEYYIAAVCDGMGGLAGGELASQTAVRILEEDVQELEDDLELPEFLKTEALRIDRAVCSLRSLGGRPLDAGTTIVTVLIHKDRLFWMSVGDSRIYYIHAGCIFCVTREHNYRLSLDILKKRGQISEENYNSEKKRGEALISYLGMGNLRLIDGNSEAITLKRGDIILLCSDGLYKNVPEEQILGIIQRYKNQQEAADALTSYVMDHISGSQDNASAVLISFG